MSSVYTPTAVVLGNITLPSDGDAHSAASVNAPLAAIADGVAFAMTASPARIDSLTAASGNWTCPAGVTSVTLEMCGGGGGGGGGVEAGVSDIPAGGGGGGGAQLFVKTVTVVPTTVYAYVCGAGGAGGAVTANGADGTDSTFGSLATARGAGKGYPGFATESGVAESVSIGGLADKSAYRPAAPYEDADVTYTTFQQGAGSGGEGVSSLTLVSRNGIASPGYAGGVAGGTSGSGCGGGGGGAGAGGAGGAGANAAGVAGTAGAANTGAGGGGGFSAPNGASSSRSAGGAGGRGFIRVRYSGVQATFT